jgi:tRNA(Arg) A34 adenosine deaminase TadA
LIDFGILWLYNKFKIRNTYYVLQDKYYKNVGGMTMKLNHEDYLKRAIEVSKKSRESGNTPFGAILVDGEGNILMEQGNVEITEHRCTGHAETTLVEKASQKYSKDFLWNCTLYTTAEPCAMCSGAIYWGNIGTVVYAMEERTLLRLTGSHEQNPTFDLPCRDVFAKGQKDIKVIGPFESLSEEAAQVHMGYWK